MQRRRLKKGPHTLPPSTTGETTLPNGFADDISEIDNDIDLTAPLPLPSVSRSDVSCVFSLFTFSFRIVCVNLATPHAFFDFRVWVGFFGGRDFNTWSVCVLQHGLHVGIYRNSKGVTVSCKEKVIVK